VNTDEDRDADLLRACREGDAELAAHSLRLGANPNAIDSGICTPTMRNAVSRAIEYDSPDVLALLLTYGAEIGESSKTKSIYHEQLCWLVNKPECLKTLIQTGGIAPQRRHMEWALEWNNAELILFLRNQGLSDSPIEYNVDEILELPGAQEVVFALAARLPEAWSRLAGHMFKQEVVIRDIYDFQISIGSCIDSVVHNGDFECLAKARAALESLPPTNALQALLELEGILALYDFQTDPKMRYSHIDYDEEAFEEDLKAHSKKWFYESNGLSLWDHPEHLEEALKFIRREATILRQRAVEQ